MMLRSKILMLLILPDFTKLATNATLDAKINEIIIEIPSITNLATTAGYTTNTNVSYLVKKNRKWRKNLQVIHLMQR